MFPIWLIPVKACTKRQKWAEIKQTELNRIDIFQLSSVQFCCFVYVFFNQKQST